MGRAAGARGRAGIALARAGLAFMVPAASESASTIGPTWLTNRIRLPPARPFSYMAPSFRPVPREGAHVGQTRRDHHGEPVGLAAHAPRGRDTRRPRDRLRQTHRFGPPYP